MSVQIVEEPPTPTETSGKKSKAQLWIDKAEIGSFDIVSTKKPVASKKTIVWNMEKFFANENLDDINAIACKFSMKPFGHYEQTNWCAYLSFNKFDGKKKNGPDAGEKEFKFTDYFLGEGKICCNVKLVGHSKAKIPCRIWFFIYEPFVSSFYIFSPEYKSKQEKIKWCKEEQELPEIPLTWTSADKGVVLPTDENNPNASLMSTRSVGGIKQYLDQKGALLVKIIIEAYSVEQLFDLGFGSDDSNNN